MLYPQGTLQRRGGTRYVTGTYQNERARLLTHIFSNDDATLLVATDQRFRFIKDLKPLPLDTTAEIVNGDFSDGLTGWTNRSSSGGTIIVGSGHALINPSDGTAIGTLTGGGGLAAAFDGDTTKTRAQCASHNNTRVAYGGRRWTTGAKTVSGFYVYGSSDVGFKDGSAEPTITVTLQGSNDNFASTSKDLKVWQFQDGPGRYAWAFSAVDVTTAYTSHRVKFEGGAGDKGFFVAQIQFYERRFGDGSLDLVNTTGTAAAQQVVTGATAGVRHVLRFEVRGQQGQYVRLRIGTEELGEDLLTTTSFYPGFHTVEFFPLSDTFYIRFYNPTAGTTISLANVALVQSEMEMVHPWSAEELDRLRTAQSGDILFIVSGTTRPYQLERYSDYRWSLVRVDFQDGPWRDENVTDIKLTPAAVTVGARTTLTASDAFFDPEHVGALFRLPTPSGKLQFEPWASGKSFTAGAETVHSGNVYRNTATTSKTTGNIPPTHEAGTVNDKLDGTGVPWEYLHSGYGVVRVLSYLSPTQVSVEVLSRIPTATQTDGTLYWRESAWSPYRGWPSVIGFFGGRMLFADDKGAPGTVWMSRVDDFTNFALGDEDDDPITVRLVSSNVDEVHTVRWFSGTDKLIVGTSGGTWRLQASNQAEPLSPSNIAAFQQTSEPSGLLPAILANGTVLYVARHGRSIYELGYDLNRDAYLGNDLTLLSEHILTSGVADLAYTRSPYPTVWCARRDGTLASLLYVPQQEIFGWSRYKIGGFVDEHGTYADGVIESIAAVPGNLATDTAERDILWLVVRRELGGQTVRYVEYLERPLRLEDAEEDAFYVDAGATFTTPSIAIQAVEERTVSVNILAPGHGLTEGEIIEITGCVGATELNNKRWMVTLPGNRYFALADPVTGEQIAPSDVSPWVSGGTVHQVSTVVDGLDHLEGQTVSVLADGKPHLRQTVSGGEITLERACRIAQVGIRYQSKVTSLKVADGAASGTPLGARKRISKLTLVVERSWGGLYDRGIGEATFPIPYPGQQEAETGELKLLRTTEIDLPFPGEWAGDVRWTLDSEEPAPLNILAVVPETTVSR